MKGTMPLGLYFNAKTYKGPKTFKISTRVLAKMLVKYADKDMIQKVFLEAYDKKFVKLKSDRIVLK